MAAAATTGTTLTELVNAEFIEPLIMDYAVDKMVITPLVRVSNLAGKQTKIASFPRWVKDSGADVSDGSAMTVDDLETTEVATVTAATVGVYREVTDMAAETNVLGPAGIADYVARDGAMLCSEMLEDDLAARFASASNSVGTSGSDLSVANFVEALAKLDTTKARGQKVCVLDDQQAFDLRAAVAASGAAVFGNAASGAQSILNANSDAFLGELFGVKTWLTNLTDTANSGADVVGAMMINGAADPGFAPIGVALLWLPRVKMLPSISGISTLFGITMSYGEGEINDDGYVKIVTDA